MKVLVTSATSRMGRLAADALADGHEVVQSDLPSHGGGKDGIAACDLNHDEATDELVQGIDVVVHPGYDAHPGDATWLIDYHTRRSYNVLHAAVDAGVPRALYLSTLRLLDGYEHRLTVTERWKPLPSTNDEIIAVHLGEYVFREYAREEPISTTILRLGFPVLDGSRHDAEASGEPAALATDDLALALNAALAAEWPRYRVIHVQSPVANGRYLMSTAESAIGYPAAGEGAAR